MLSTLAPGLLLAAASPAALAADAPAIYVAASAEPTSGAAPAGPELADPLDDPAAAAAPPLPDAAAAPKKVRTHATEDPYESLNRKVFNAHQKGDRAFLRPVAMGYKHVVPAFMRDGIRNVLLLLTEPIVFLNDLLQFRPKHAARTLGRAAVNATMGWGGLFDIAKRPAFKLPHEPNGFGDTLGYYGVKPGAYLFLPLIGPTTVRDLIGGAADSLVLPFAVGEPFDRQAYQLPTGIVGGLDARAEADQDLRTLFSTAVDPYATLRSVYLQDRAGEIAALKQGSAAKVKDPLAQDLTDPLAKPAGPAAPDASVQELADPLADPAATAPAAH
jgi:phospholipid-binding lipoprotein MlaA